MLRAIIIFIKDKVLFFGSGIIDVQKHAGEEVSLLELQGTIDNENKVHVAYVSVKSKLILHV